MFQDRVEAGRLLAAELKEIGPVKDGVVVAIPRGGVVVGAEVAKALDIPIDVIVPRKIGAPFNPEVAVGAVTEDGTTIFDERALRLLGLARESLDDAVKVQLAEIARRTQLYRSGKDPLPLEGKTVILVDDGVATGYTTLAALRSVKNARPARVVLAVPVAPPDTAEMLSGEVDEMICLLTPEPFYAVGQFYRRFDQTTDEEVIALLARRRRA
ncbi:phosphoribosyltransferase [Desulforudis sp. 1088]|uniref:phosphoribosyltransferase n=1 Tax=unclassified Candidatus Desulforudis TaxID=2635950 RepID=UPI00349439AA